MNDELRRAISIAQTVYDRNGGPADNTAVVIGALIRAVTILAGERPTLHEEAVNVCKEMRDAAVRAFPQTSSGDDSFSGDLVDVLIEAFVRGTKNGALPTREGVRAILSELALIPIELPSQGQIIQAMRNDIRGWGPERAVEFTRGRIAHFLNAQKVRIADLEQHAATLEGLARQYKTERDHVEETCKIQRERIDVLEKRLTETIVPNQPTLDRDSTLMMLSRARERIASLAAFLNATEVRGNAATIVQGVIDTIIGEPQSSGISGQLDEGLVEQLVDAYAKGCDSTRHGEDFCKNGIRAILAELATMPCELPNGVLLPAGDATGAAHVVLDMMRPILAAKSAVVNVAHARIAELESDRKNLLARIDAAEATSLLPLVQENERLMGALIAIAGPGPRDAAPERAIESAKHNSEIILSMISEAQRDLEAMTKIRVEREALAARVVELEKQLATLNDWAAICGEKTPTVDGKTPGQVDYEGYTAARFGACADNFTPWHRLADDFQRFNEAGAQSVLRVHGRVMAKQAASDALSTLRRRFEFVPQKGDADDGKWVSRADVLNAIDTHCEPPTNAAGATPAHVARDAFLSEFGNIPDAMEVGGAKLEAWGRVALAILNSFGGTSEAMQTAQNEIARLKIHGRFTRHLAAEALGRVQKRLMPTARNEHYNINTRTIQEAFDNELAALESVKPAQQ